MDDTHVQEEFLWYGKEWRKLSQATVIEISAFCENFQKCKYHEMGHTQPFTKYMMISFHSTVYNLCIVNLANFFW
jgi:hypothetical protein